MDYRAWAALRAVGCVVRVDLLDRLPAERAAPVPAVSLGRLFLDLLDDVAHAFPDLFRREVPPARQRIDNDNLLGSVVLEADLLPSAASLRLQPDRRQKPN